MLYETKFTNFALTFRTHFYTDQKKGNGIVNDT